MGESYYHAACFTCTECHASLSKGANRLNHDYDDGDPCIDFQILLTVRGKYKLIISDQFLCHIIMELELVENVE